MSPESNHRQFSISPILHPSTSGSTLIQNNSLTTLPKVKRKLVSISRDITPIPMLDLTSNEAIDLQQIDKDPFVGISTDYVDHLDQTLICHMCHAILWTYEGRKGRANNGKKGYMICCSYGKVQLPDLKPLNPDYKDLFLSLDSERKYFMKIICRYKAMFSFTSMGGKIDSSINRVKGPYIFRLSGQNCHSIESLLPEDGCKPMFAQVYIHDTQNEIANRQSYFSDSINASSSNSNSMDLELTEGIKDMLDAHNILVKNVRMVRDSLHKEPKANLKLRLIGKRKQDGRTYNLPKASEVAALIIGDIGGALENRDIIVTTALGKLKRISQLHPSYLPLQYPILFPYGDDGYSHIGLIFFIEVLFLKKIK